MTIEAILLTGGGSTRMGVDKAKIVVGGIPLDEATATALGRAVDRVAVLGREPVADWGFLADQADQAGPLAALARFSPEAEFVFVASCDMPYFHQKIVEILQASIREADAAVPVRAGIRQPTCALYRKRAWDAIPKVVSDGKRSLMAWLDRLEVTLIDEEALREASLDPIHFASFNTPEELAQIEAEWAAFIAAPEPPPAPEE